MNHRALLPVLLAALALTSGCNLLPEPQPDRARYYVLDARPAANDTAPSARLVLGLRPVEVAGYLKHKAIVTRAGENEIRYAPEAFWAEPIETAVARALRERLSGRATVFNYPFPSQVSRDYDITVRVLAAEGSATGVRFSAVAEILRVGEKPEVVARREFTAPANAWGSDYARLAGGLSDAVAALADEIAASLPLK